jgi:hypothetical protein
MLRRFSPARSTQPIYFQHVPHSFRFSAKPASYFQQLTHSLHPKISCKANPLNAFRTLCQKHRGVGVCHANRFTPHSCSQPSNFKLSNVLVAPASRRQRASRIILGSFSFPLSHVNRLPGPNRSKSVPNPLFSLQNRRSSRPVSLIPCPQRSTPPAGKTPTRREGPLQQ